MDPTQLRTPILSGGIKSINFFNGRLLSAEDLSLEKRANKEARQDLGKAIGDGIVYGLEVKEALDKSSKKAPVLTVSEGLAVNRNGQTLRLNSSIAVALVRPAEIGNTTASALFADCQPVEQNSYIVGQGAYLLTIQTGWGMDGKAPVSGLGNLEAVCNAKYQIDGVQFRLIQLPITSAESSDIAHLRNHLAYRCFGVSGEAVTSFPASPFGPVLTKYGLLDDLRSNCLKDDEVPLALIYWTTANGIEFVDMWSVRRRVTQRSVDADWPLLVSDRRAAEGEAMFLQFQEQVQDMLLSRRSLLEAVAQQSFEYLPPVGLLPIAQTGRLSGIQPEKFFGGMKIRDLNRDPLYLEGARLGNLLHEALVYPPISTASEELVWIYHVRENQAAAEPGKSNSPSQYLIFANGHLPYWENARYDLNRWDYSNWI